MSFCGILDKCNDEYFKYGVKYYLTFKSWFKLKKTKNSVLSTYQYNS